MKKLDGISLQFNICLLNIYTSNIYSHINFAKIYLTSISSFYIYIITLRFNLVNTSVNVHKRSCRRES